MAANSQALWDYIFPKVIAASAVIESAILPITHEEISGSEEGKYQHQIGYGVILRGQTSCQDHLVSI